MIIIFTVSLCSQFHVPRCLLTVKGDIYLLQMACVDIVVRVPFAAMWKHCWLLEPRAQVSSLPWLSSDIHRQNLQRTSRGRLNIKRGGLRCFVSIQPFSWRTDALQVDSSTVEARVGRGWEGSWSREPGFTSWEFFQQNKYSEFIGTSTQTEHIWKSLWNKCCYHLHHLVHPFCT